MIERYCILRVSRRGETRSQDSGDLSARTRSLAEPSTQLDVADLSARDVADLSSDDDVVAFTPAMPTRRIAPLGEPDAAPPDSGTRAWGLGAIGADGCPFDGAGVTVAILDSGIDASHPAFAGVELRAQDFVGEGIDDVADHGTHCAGTVFGRDVDGVRIGVARGVRTALIGKVLDASGGGESDALFRGLQWALEGGAKVVSISLGFDFPGMVERLARRVPIAAATSMALAAYRSNLRMFDALVDVARARIPFDGGAVLVAAAGNESTRDRVGGYDIAVSLPAAADGVVSVGAVDDAFQVAGFSNSHPTLSAPGVGILSAAPGGGLRRQSGTSMATPHVAGVAALWWQALGGRRGATADTVVHHLVANARTDAIAAGTPATLCGRGLITAPSNGVRQRGR